jgi:uncharacterized protein
MSTASAPPEMEEPRWLVDEMLGRLSRYLRFLGYDAEYVRGVSDDRIVARAREEGRRLITRDRTLSGRLPEAVLLSRTDIAGQMRELRAAYPELRFEVRFDRCSLCNGRLVAGAKVPSEGPVVERLPPEVRQGRTPLYACQTCGHLYWEGSHTRNVRRRLAEWNRSTPEGG